MQLARLSLLPNDVRPRHPLDGESAFALIEGESARILDAAPWLDGKPTGQGVAWRERKLLAPVDPRKILCIARNYVEHARELGNEVPNAPMLFMKPSSALIGPGDAIVLPKESARVEHEAELGVVIGRRARNVTEDEALSFVFGYTCVLDITARDLQKSDGQWARAKGFDTFCPVGPFVVTDLDPLDLAIRCTVDGELRQDGRTSQMAFGVARLIAHTSHMMTLEPGDLLVTGTPSGVGPLHDGQRIDVDIEGIGRLSCDVRGS